MVIEAGAAPGKRHSLHFRRKPTFGQDIHNYEDHVTPDRLSEFDAEANQFTTLKSLAAQFDTGELEVHQHMAKSADGTSTVLCNPS